MINDITLTDPAEIEKEIDDMYLAQVRYELDLSYRRCLLDWSRQFGSRFSTSVFSAVNGAWDDVRNDLRKGSINIDQANMLIDEFFKFKLISRGQLLFYKDQFLEILSDK